MAYKDINTPLDHGIGETQDTAGHAIHLQISGDTVDLPNESFVRDADISRDGADLVLNSHDGTIVVDNYFSGLESPALIAPNGATLSPQLVDSFMSHAPEYAQNTSMNDVSPIGAVQEISGHATITRADGTTEPLSISSPVYQGDIIETAAGSAVNVVFVDESSFAVSEDTRLSIDEYVFDPTSQGGSQDFSVLKGVFVYTSGLIGRADPDDVNIDTPIGSIGIRGTIIAGDVNQGEITVVEGAIVLRDLGGTEITLSSQFETGRFMSGNRGIENIGQKSAHDLAEKYSIVSTVTPTLFSSINDAAAEQATQPDQPQNNDKVDLPNNADAHSKTPQEFDANGTTDQNGDNKVDGTVIEGTTDAPNDKGVMLDNQNGEMTTQGSTMAEISHALGIISNPMETMMTSGNTIMKSMNMTATTTMMTPSMLANDMTIMNMLDTQTQQTTTMTTTVITQSQLPISISTVDIPPPINFKSQGYTTNTVSIAPNTFFAATENETWNYHFDKEFGGQISNYKLGATTITMLNNLTSNGILNTWTFDATNHGQLILNFASDFSTGGITAGVSNTFQIKIAAYNSEGDINQNGFISYNFSLFNDNGSALTSNLSGVTSQTYSTTSGTTLNIGLTADTINNTVFLSDQNDTVNIDAAGGFTISGNKVYLGNGTNTASTQNASSSSINNIIIGGDQSDTMIIGQMQNKFYGMDGDDVIDLNINYASTLSTGLSNTLYDGGHSNFYAKSAINGPAANTGIGDTLKITGTGGTLDFSNISQYFDGIERLDLSGSGVSATVTLSYQDVINMTDNNNTLLIRASTGDDITYNNFNGRGFVQTKDNIQIDDDGDNNLTNFDVYTNGNVTLIVEDSGATTNVASAFA